MAVLVGPLWLVLRKNMGKARDYKFFSDQRIRAARNAAQDSARNALHRQFDLSAQDHHSKSERPSFTVVTASEAYRAGWERMFGHASKPEGSAPKGQPVLEKDTAEGQGA